jgi:hypothetical protein
MASLQFPFSGLSVRRSELDLLGSGRLDLVISAPCTTILYMTAADNPDRVSRYGV